MIAVDQKHYFTPSPGVTSIEVVIRDEGGTRKEQQQVVNTASRNSIDHLFSSVYRAKVFHDTV